MQAFTIIVNGDKPVSVAAATPVSDVVSSVAPDGSPVIGAIVNNMVQPLYAPLLSHAKVEPVSTATKYGRLIYRDTLCFLLAKVIHEQFPGLTWRVRSSIGPALFCSVEPDSGTEWTEEMLAEIRTAMHKTVESNLAIVGESFSYEDAVSIFEKHRQIDKLHLILHRNPPFVYLTRCGEFFELSKKPLANRTGIVDIYELRFLKEGFVLNVPDDITPDQPAELKHHEYLLDVCREHMRWGEILGVTTVGELNRTILEKRGDDFILTAEALHDKKLSMIADQITTCQKPLKLILVAGPSSAGKTTFAKRLVTHLRVNGLHPVLISTDNYFLGDELNPRDENGNLDYEHIEAVDLTQLNSDILALMDDRSVRLRGFDFVNRCGFIRKNETRLEKNGIIVMEGIHCLNPRLTSAVNPENKFLIYVNALTQLSVDANNRISTNDTRVIRRIVRDHKFRNRSAITTLSMWESVMRGERHWIYPYQHLSDAIFNSALSYELAVLKPMTTALLNQVKPWDREYLEARRLEEFLYNFTALSADSVPGDSILREYIGGSQLKYG
ncbi:MAG: nucleoside kinase [Kiritimatiellia bacterium]